MKIKISSVSVIERKTSEWRCCLNYAKEKDWQERGSGWKYMRSEVAETGMNIPADLMRGTFRQVIMNYEIK